MTTPRVIDRRTVSKLGAMGLAASPWLGSRPLRVLAQTPVSVAERLVIDLNGSPESINPFLAYSPRDWSIVHSIYDSPLGFAADGSIEPLAAESFELVDETTFELVLQSGLTFHDGSPVTADAIARSIQAMKDSGSEASSLFAGVTSVDVGTDGLSARIVCDAPSPWLPAQIATWIVLIPESWTPDLAVTNPIGSGPFIWDSEEAGASLTLHRNPEYTWGSPKGEPLAEVVDFRYVPESTTRVADLSSGTAQIVTEIPNDQASAIEDAGATFVSEPIVASSWIRIATDTPPFDDVRVRQALNLAIDVESIAQSLISDKSHRLANLFPDERALGFSDDVTPYAYDPEAAKALLQEVGVEPGQKLALEVTDAAQVDVTEVIASQLGEVGFEVEIVTSPYAAFNQNWAEASAPVLRMVTWGPLYEPQSLLNLVFANDGYLSRFTDPEVDRLIKAAAIEPDDVTRASLLVELGQAMHDAAPAIFLWNLVANYGVTSEATGWSPRGDEYVIPTRVTPA